MDRLSQLEQRVAQLTQWFNDLMSGAKTNDDFPMQSVLDELSKMRVYRDSVSEIVTIKMILDEAVVRANTNRFIIVNGSELDVNSLTVNAGWQWNISGYLFSNASEVVLDIPFADTGKARIDLLVADMDNNFYIVTGTESTLPTPPLAPTTPTNTLLASFLYVTDDSISTPVDPNTQHSYYVKGWPNETALESSRGNPIADDFGFIENDGVIESIAFYTGTDWVYTTLGGGGGMNSLQEMYDYDPENTTISDGNGNKLVLDASNVLSLTDLFGSNTTTTHGFYDQETSALGLISAGIIDGKIIVELVLLDENGKGTRLTNYGQLNLGVNAGGFSSGITVRNLTGDRENDMPDADGTLGVSVKVNGVSYPFNSNGETDDIYVGATDLSAYVKGDGTQTTDVDLNDKNLQNVANVQAVTFNGGTLSGDNTGDQSSIVGITGTKSQFDTALTDGNFLYVGDVTQYTDEMAQDAVGAMVDATLVYTDANPSLGRAAISGDVVIAAGSNTAAIGPGVIVDSDVSASAAIAGTKIANTPSGNIAATTVQGAINELDLAIRKTFTHKFMGGIVNYLDNTSYYYNGSNSTTPITSSSRYEYAGINATSVDFSMALVVTSVLGSAENATVSIKNVTTNVTVTLTSTLKANAVSNGAVGSVAFACTAGDLLEIIVACPTYSTNPTGCVFNATIQLTE